MNEIIDVEKINKLITEYLADPNCYPELWISSENVTNAEKEFFIKETINYKKNFLLKKL